MKTTKIEEAKKEYETLRIRLIRMNRNTQVYKVLIVIASLIAIAIGIPIFMQCINGLMPKDNLVIAALCMYGVIAILLIAYIIQVIILKRLEKIELRRIVKTIAEELQKENK